eukprot:3323741-Prymnesium_polylepis.1
MESIHEAAVQSRGGNFLALRGCKLLQCCAVVDARHPLHKLLVVDDAVAAGIKLLHDIGDLEDVAHGRQPTVREQGERARGGGGGPADTCCRASASVNGAFPLGSVRMAVNSCSSSAPVLSLSKTPNACSSV